MSPYAEALVTTRDARRHLAALCGQLDGKAQQKPELGVRVEWTETEGTIDFSWARCTVRADDTTLTLRAEADDDDAIREVCELVTRHLQAHADLERPAISWLRDGRPVTGSTDVAARDAMRKFHARMRP